MVTQMSETNQIPKICDQCNNEMTLSENDVIFDKKWYHKQCWEERSI